MSDADERVCFTFDDCYPAYKSGIDTVAAAAHVLASCIAAARPTAKCAHDGEALAKLGGVRLLVLAMAGRPVERGICIWNHAFRKLPSSKGSWATWLPCTVASSWELMETAFTAVLRGPARSLAIGYIELAFNAGRDTRPLATLLCSFLIRRWRQPPHCSWQLRDVECKRHEQLESLAVRRRARPHALPCNLPPR